MAVNVYSFLDVAVTLAGPGGTLQLGAGAGVAEEGVTITRATDKNDMKIGADGTPMMSLRGDKSGTVTVRLMKTSLMNARLSDLYLIQTASSAFWAQNVLIIQDTARSEITTCRLVAFKKMPDLTYTRDGTMYEWPFDAGLIDTILG